MWWVQLGGRLPDWFPVLHPERQALLFKGIECCNSPTRRSCQISGRSSKIGHRMPMGGTSGSGFGMGAWGTTCSSSQRLAGDAAIELVCREQLLVYQLFPRSFSALVSTNLSSGLLFADPHSKHGQSPLCTQSGLAHMHITSKGTGVNRAGWGFSCRAHKGLDGPMATSCDTQRSLGVWWPLGKAPVGPAFGVPGYLLDLRSAVAALFSTSHEHGSVTTNLPPGVDIIGTSTEVSKAAHKHCAAR